MKRFLTVAFAALLMFSLASCETTKGGGGAGGGAVNANCAMQDTEAVKAGCTIDHNGTTVGFCCNRCKEGFEKLSDAEKDAKVASLKKK